MVHERVIGDGYPYRARPVRGDGIGAFGEELEVVRDAPACEGGVDLLKEADPAVEELLGFVFVQAAVALAVVVSVVIVVVSVGMGRCDDGEDKGKEDRQEQGYGAHLV